MADLILHHFLASPFSEKIRLVLGYKQLAWKSVLIPSILPKPDLVSLTGGYRKTPVLQLGADIFCDTSLICEVLEKLEPNPSIYPESVEALARILAQWADSSLFWAAIAGPKPAEHMYGGMPGAAKAFAADRNAMFGGMTRPLPADAAAATNAYLRRLTNMLQHQPYLLGHLPSIADFAAYHALWFTRIRTPADADILQHLPALDRWMDRMQAMGHGAMENFDSTQAMAVAAGCEPSAVGQGLLRDGVFQDEHSIALGSRVAICAESFGAETTEGELVAATRTHFSLRRVDERVGMLHVHFPRIGYVLSKL